ncbi:MAG: HEAT repeat domain-containing protein, partial [Gemmatimonadaceae bacterium]
MTTAARVSEAQGEHGEPPFPPALVEELLRLLAKAFRAHQLYLPNNPIYIKATDAVRSAFAAVWAHTGEFGLVVTETAFVWEGRHVFDEPSKSVDSLPWLFYKDGVRDVTFAAGFEAEELVGLLEILQRVRRALPEEDDLITMLWEKDFARLRYRYVDLSTENAAAIDSTPAADRPTQLEASPVVEVEETRAAGIVSLADFDATLYFLDEKEVEYLHTQVHREYQDDLRLNVLAMLLDIFETQRDPAVRDEVIDVLEGFMVHLLSAGNFSAVAYLLAEAQAAVQRARGLEAQHAQRIAGLPDRLSDPEALSQLLQSLDEREELPPQSELTALFTELRASALGTVFSWVGRSQNARLRTLLEEAATRLASSNTAELVRLIGTADRVVSVEAVRRAGALRTAAAVAPLAKLMTEGDVALRLAGVQALAEIGSPGALQVIERAIEDADRDVRVSAARALSARAYRPALARVEAAVRGKRIGEADLTEKMAIFEAYGAICGDAGVALLDGLLNAKPGMFARKVDPELRACAALALGRVATPKATESLQRA